MLLRRSLFVSAFAAALLTAGGLFLLAQAKAPEVPPFTITGEQLDLDMVAGKLTYEGRVVFTSPRNDTTITCAKMQANAANAKKVTAVTATGNVVVTMTANLQQRNAAGAVETVPYKVTVKGATMVYDLVGETSSLKLAGEGGVRPSVTAVEATPGAGEKDSFTLTADSVTVFPAAMQAAGKPATLVESAGNVVLTGEATIVEKDAKDKPVRYAMRGTAATCLYRLEPAGNATERLMTLKSADAKSKAAVTIRKTDAATKQELDVYDLQGTPITYNIDTGAVKAGAASTTHGGGNQ